MAVHSFEKRCFLRAESGQGDDAYMSVQAGAVLRLPVLYLPRRPAPRLAIFSCWQSMALVAARHRNLVFPLTLAASALTGVLIWTLMDGQETKPDTTSLAPVRNETVVYRQARRPEPRRLARRNRAQACPVIMDGRARLSHGRDGVQACRGISRVVPRQAQSAHCRRTTNAAQSTMCRFFQGRL